MSRSDFAQERPKSVALVPESGSYAGQDHYYRYNSLNQKVGDIGADPDGAGGLPRVATRMTYNAAGQIAPKKLTGRVGRYIAAVRPGGSCHLLRHTAATLMLEGGADIRYIQALLDHKSFDTTQI